MSEIEHEEEFESDMSSDVEYEIKNKNGLNKNWLNLSKRPTRKDRIGNDDLLNLQIALETAKTIDEFISMV